MWTKDYRSIWHSTYKMRLKHLRRSESLNTTSYYYIFEVIIKVVLLGLKPQSKVGYRCPKISVSGEKAHLSSLHLLKSAVLEANIKKFDIENSATGKNLKEFSGNWISRVDGCKEFY